MDTLTTTSGTNFYQLKVAALKYGFDCFGENSQLISEDNLPVIVQLKIKDGLYHFIVVYKIIDNMLICMDPSIGIKNYSFDEFKKLFTGNILRLTPINKIVTYKKNNYLKKLLFQMIKENKLYLIIIFLVSVLIIGLSLFYTYSLKIVFRLKTYKIIFILFGLIIIKNVLNYIKGFLLAHLNLKNNIKIITDYINHIFYLPSKYLQLKGSGEITSRINDLNNMREFFSNEIINILISLCTLISTFVISSMISKILSILLMIYSLLFLSIIYFITKNSFKIYLNTLDSESRFMDQIIEYIHNLITIKNLNKESFFLKKLEETINTNYQKYYNLDKYHNNLNLLSNTYIDLGLIIITFIGLILNESIDNIFIIILFNNYISESITYLSSLLPQIMYFKSVLIKVNGIYYLNNKNKKKDLKFQNNSIIISNLNYEINLNKIFNNFNLRIIKGQKVLITGNNGTGKSTLLNMLNQNIDDYSGTISINNINLKDINNNDLKNHIILNKQNDNLFCDTIINNIILDKPYNHNKLLKISKLLKLNKIINTKPNGYNTIVKNNLSGGEKQRIILARCLYQNPEILLLDESLSEVSYYLRLKIINNINHYYKDKTIIYVSHFKEIYPFDQIINLTARKEMEC